MKKLPFLIITILLVSRVSFCADTYQLQVKTSDWVPEIQQTFNDAQYFTCQDTQIFSDCKSAHHDELEAARKTRISNQISIIKNPAKSQKLTKEDMLQVITDEQNQINSIQSDIEAKQTQLDGMK